MTTNEYNTLEAGDEIKMNGTVYTIARIRWNGTMELTKYRSWHVATTVTPREAAEITLSSRRSY
jgi:hypothetical protein